jgi:hypothetical protein
MLPRLQLYIQEGLPEDTKGEIRNRISKSTKQWPNEKGQKGKERSTKHYTENKRWSNTNPTKNRGLTSVLSMGKQFLLQ